MRIERITWQHHNDYVADMVCEHCAAKDVDKCGYNDANYHNNVIPRFYCQSCGKNRAGDMKKPVARDDVAPSYSSPAAWPFPVFSEPVASPAPAPEPAFSSGGGGDFGGGGASSSWSDSSSSSDSNSGSSSDSGSCSSSSSD